MILENKKKGNNGIIFTLVLPYDNFCMEMYVSQTAINWRGGDLTLLLMTHIPEIMGIATSLIYGFYFFPIQCEKL